MIVTKNGKMCLIRTAKVQDAEAILNIQRNVVSERNYVITDPEEFDKTLEQQIEWIKSILENERETILVAELEGEIAGWLIFHTQNRKRLAHTGSFGIMISNKYRNIGIGRMLLSALLDWARKNPLIEKVSLGVFSTNHKAIALYKSMGFVEEGHKIREFKFGENEYVDDVLMYQLVD